MSVSSVAMTGGILAVILTIAMGMLKPLDWFTVVTIAACCGLLGFQLGMWYLQRRIRE